MATADDDFTPNLDLPFVLANQSQKHVTVNESLRKLDAVAQIGVQSRGQGAPPGSATNGEAWIVPAGGGSGEWAWHEGEIVVWQENAWAFHAPQTGWLAYVADEGVPLVFDGAGWTPLATTFTDPQNLSLFGLGTTANAANPFSAKLNAALWTARPSADGGTGDLRYTLNKELASDTLSLLFQTGFDARAEIGLTGDDDIRLKVSPDGTQFLDALIADRTTGEVQLPNTLLTDASVTVLGVGSGTYVAPEGVAALRVTAIGGGGGGAGAEVTNTATFCSAGGGGGGGTVIVTIPHSDLEPSYTYGVGAGGSGGAASAGAPVGSRNGSPGIATTFSGTSLSLTANGGNGAPEDTPSVSGTQFSGGQGGTATGGDINLTGGAGGGGVTDPSSYYQIGVGAGGSTPLGIGAPFRNGNGLSGTGYGAGGAGAGAFPNYAFNRNGGAGADGVLIIEEIYG